MRTSYTFCDCRILVTLDIGCLFTLTTKNIVIAFLGNGECILPIIFN